MLPQYLFLKNIIFRTRPSNYVLLFLELIRIIQQNHYLDDMSWLNLCIHYMALIYLGENTATPTGKKYTVALVF